MSQPAVRLLGKAILIALLPSIAGAESPRSDVAKPTKAMHLPMLGTPCLSGDGKVIACRGTENSICLIDTATGREQRRVPIDSWPVHALALSPDATTLAVAYEDGTIGLYDVRSGKRRLHLLGHRAPLRVLTFSPNGKLLASAGGDGTIRLWNAVSGKDLLLLEGHKHPIVSLAFTPDGRILASSSEDAVIRLWELASGQEVLAIDGQERRACQVAFAADGRALLAADREECSLASYHLGTGKQQGHLALARLEADPDSFVLRKGQRESMKVKAHWSDRSSHEVTSQCLYESCDESLLKVWPSGHLEALAPGRPCVMVRFLGRAIAVPVTVPFAEIKDYPRLAHNNFIDELAAAEWRKVGLLPADLADDRVFLRRLSLHLFGRHPTAEEAAQFMASKEKDKRSKLIDEYLDRSEFADYWVSQWAALLGLNEGTIGAKGLLVFRAWIGQALKENWPLDRIARELLTSHGQVLANGAVAFAFTGQTAEQWAESASEVFLGINLRCARCHPHPHASWGRDAYHRLVACFGRLERLEKPRGILVVHERKVIHPITGKSVTPGVLGHSLKETADEDPRVALARWLTAKDHSHLARSFVNRYWSHLFGRGLIEPHDDFRPTSLSAHPALLEALVRDFIKHDYDVKQLLRTICNSRLYQLATEPPLPEDTMFFSRRKRQRLTGEAMTRIVAQAVGLERQDLPTQVLDYLQPYEGPFVRSPRRSTFDTGCDRHPLLPSSSLMLFGSSPFTELIKHPQGRVARLLKGNAKDEAITKELFQAALGRPPSEKEMVAIQKHLAQAKDTKGRQAALEDILWLLLNTTEFLYHP